MRPRQMPGSRDTGQVMLQRTIERPSRSAWPAARPAAPPWPSVEATQQRRLERDDVVELPCLRPNCRQPIRLLRREEADLFGEDAEPFGRNDPKTVQRLLSKRACPRRHDTDTRRNAESEEKLLDVAGQRGRRRRERRISVFRDGSIRGEESTYDAPGKVGSCREGDLGQAYFVRGRLVDANGSEPGDQRRRVVEEVVRPVIGLRLANRGDAEQPGAAVRQAGGNVRLRPADGQDQAPSSAPVHRESAVAEKIPDEFAQLDRRTFGQANGRRIEVWANVKGREREVGRGKIRPLLKRNPVADLDVLQRLPHIPAFLVDHAHAVLWRRTQRVPVGGPNTTDRPHPVVIELVGLFQAFVSGHEERASMRMPAIGWRVRGTERAYLDDATSGRDSRLRNHATALFNGLRRAVEDAEERDGAGGATTGGRDEVVLRAQTREREPRPAAAVMTDESIRQIRVLLGHRQIVHTLCSGFADAGDANEEEVFQGERAEELRNRLADVEGGLDTLARQLPRLTHPIQQIIEPDLRYASYGLRQSVVPGAQPAPLARDLFAAHEECRIIDGRQARRLPFAEKPDLLAKRAESGLRTDRDLPAPVTRRRSVGPTMRGNTERQHQDLQLFTEVSRAGRQGDVPVLADAAVSGEEPTDEAARHLFRTPKHDVRNPCLARKQFEDAEGAEPFFDLHAQDADLEGVVPPVRADCDQLLEEGEAEAPNTIDDVLVRGADRDANAVAMVPTVADVQPDQLPQLRRHLPRESLRARRKAGRVSPALGDVHELGKLRRTAEPTARLHHQPGALGQLGDRAPPVQAIFGNGQEAVLRCSRHRIAAIRHHVEDRLLAVVVTLGDVERPLVRHHGAARRHVAEPDQAVALHERVPSQTLMDDRRRLHGVEDLFHGIADGKDVTSRVLKPVALARVHERWRVRQELAVHHHVVEGFRDLAHRCRGAAVPRLARRNGHRHPPAHFLRRLRDLTVFPAEITLPEDTQRGLGPLADLGRTRFGQHRRLPPLKRFRRPAVPAAGDDSPRGGSPLRQLYLVVGGNLAAESRAVKEKGVHHSSTMNSQATHRVQDGADRRLVRCSWYSRAGRAPKEATRAYR